jgi:hypothetical protein
LKFGAINAQGKSPFFRDYYFNRRVTVKRRVDVIKPENIQSFDCVEIFYRHCGSKLKDMDVYKIVLMVSG